MLKNMKATPARILHGSRFRLLQAALLVISIVGVFAVLSLWAPVDLLLIVLVVIAFSGGAGLGKRAGVLVSLTVAAIVVRAELVAAHPVRVRTFVLGGLVIVMVLGGVALVGAQARRVLRRPSVGQQSVE
jgi:hypothetical protein